MQEQPQNWSEAVRGEVPAYSHIKVRQIRQLLSKDHYTRHSFIRINAEVYISTSVGSSNTSCFDTSYSIYLQKVLHAISRTIEVIIRLHDIRFIYEYEG